MITIRHTHADGTTVEGSRKGDGVYDILRQPPHRFRFFPSSRTIGIQASRDKLPQQARINAAAEALRGAGFDVTIELEDGYRTAAEREEDRAERAEDRAQRYDAQAHRLGTQAASRRASADRVFDAIPFGQPMLIGHHSYNADRNRREKAVNSLRKSFELADEAKEKSRRADAAITNLEHREAPRTTMRRLEKLRADTRDWQRRLQDETPGTAYHTRGQQELARLTDEISYWQAHLDTLAETGEFTAWTQADFRKGDHVNVNGHWREVKRVNKKTVTVQSDYSWTDTAAYDKIYGRRRDGIQHDAPNGAPVPVAEAKLVERWRELRNRFPRLGFYDADTRSQHQAITKALKTVLAITDRVEDRLLLERHAADPRTPLELATACLAIYTEARQADGYDH